MIDAEVNRRYCQSCGMPLRFDVEEYLGTKQDGSRSEDHCYYCLKDGHYTVDVSMTEMIDIWVKYTDKYNDYSGTHYSPHELKTVLNKRMPTLNRWHQKQETRMIHQQAVRKISRYIDDHLSEPLEMEELARMSGLSFFHFRRVFKTVTGECIAGYIQRLRLEHIAGLLISTNLTLDELLCQTNYLTKFSLAKAFKKHFGISTSEYRKSYKQSPVTCEEVTTIPEIRFVANTTVLYIEVGDTYNNRYLFRKKWSQMVRYAKQNKLDGAFGAYMSLSLDDPLITQRDKCRFYLGLTVPFGTEPEPDYGILTIPFARYAVFRHIGSYGKLHTLYQAIYENWMPHSNYRPKGTFSFEMYLNSPMSTRESDLVTEVYIPIEKR